VSAVICLGDLQRSWIESLERVRLPKLGVYGNHDHDPYVDRFGIEDMHLRRIELDHGPSITGFEGCMTCPGRRSEAGPSYSRREARRLIRRLPPADILLRSPRTTNRSQPASWQSRSPGAWLGAAARC